ncbi:hypothetical protein [Chryseobacterium sp. MP_3.2]|uniref:hypothetical protein n=1 Tax=Chryseobacterium sp. MP_3.2 TaxID=3071712 RepID=UPI002DF7E878|nr:hypothetical protein [Chryseobacterium sp. MP_3.2]
MFKKLQQQSIFLSALSKRKASYLKKNVAFLFLLTILGSSNLFAQAGKDGALTVSAANTVLSRYTRPTADIAAGATSITVTAISDLNRDAVSYLPSGLVTNAAGFASNAVAAGDLLMIYQAQGATINTANTIAYGAVTALNGAGTYELARVASVSGNTISLSCATKQSYMLAGHVQVIRVPQYTTLTVASGGSVVAIDWGSPTFGGADPSAPERRRGGFNALLANAIINNGTISANKAGFRGGTRDNNTTGVGGFNTDYVTASDALSAEKGESIAGYRVDYDAIGGRYGRGAAANGGGGGNAHNAGGGGGANGGNLANWFRGAGVMQSSGSCGATAWTLDPDYIGNGNVLTTSSGGGRGGYTYGANNLDACTQGPSYAAGSISPGNPASNVTVAWGGDNRVSVGGLGGRPITSTTFSNRIIFGGGGGAGDGNNNASNDGGDGGGIVFLVNTTTITGTGTIQANGENALNTINVGNDAPGGGGGGGSIVIQSTTISNTQTVNARGGAGGNQLIGTNESEGPGGGGGGGVITINAATDSSTKSVTGGVFGTSTSNSVTEFPANGATSGNEGTILSLSIDISVCGVCYNLPNTGIAGIDTKHGITLLQKAGADNGGWPMIRKSAHTALESNTKGFVITRMTTAQIGNIVSPQEGMMVFDLTVSCLKIYADGVWSCFTTPACP